MPERGRVAILISGRGSNMVSLVEAMRSGQIDAEPAVVLSNVPGAEGLRRAEELGVPTESVDHKSIKPRRAHDAAVVEALQGYSVDLVCLAGYMRLLSPVMVEAFRHRMLNIHPSLLPAFPGLDAQRQALEHGVKIAGCTVHFVDEKCDHGPILLQASVPVLEGDTENSLARRILEQEHLLYPKAVAQFFAGVRVEGRRVESPASR
jgi:phosphoribosylglycinamide formyltransferase-1